MNYSNFYFNLDIHSPISQVSLSVKKGETNKKLNIVLTENGQPYKLEQDCAVVFSGKKADGTIIYNDCAIKNNKIEYILTPQTTIAEGIVECEVLVYGGNSQVLFSPRFSLVIYEASFNINKDVESTNEFLALTQTMARAEAAIKQAQETDAALREKESYAIEEIPPKNLFNKNDYKSLNAYVNVTDNVLTRATEATTIYISIEPNQAYTVSKIASKRFAVGITDSETLKNGTIFTETIQRNASTAININTGENSKILAVFCHVSSADTLTVEEILETLQIEKGNTATSYEPWHKPTYNAVDRTARESVLIEKEKTKQELIGYEDDKAADNTIYGAKTYTRNEVANLKRDMTENFASKEYVEKEIATFDFIKVVTKLPETGLENRFYLVPKQDPQTQDLFDEYAWVNKGTEEEPDWDWEWLSTKKLEADLTNYATKDFVKEQIYYNINEKDSLSLATTPFEIPFGTHICEVSNVERFSPDGSNGGIFTSSKVHAAYMAEQTYKSFDSGEKYERSALSSDSWGEWKRIVSFDDVNNAAEHAKTLLEIWYDVGSVYLNFNYVNPAELLGFGEWQLIENRFLLGAGDKYESETTGGEATHTLTAAELPKQSGTIVTHGTYSGTPIADASGVFTKEHVVSGKYLSGSQGTSANSIDVIGYSNGGEGKAHNNMPPYIAVYMWRRIA